MNLRIVRTITLLGVGALICSSASAASAPYKAQITNGGSDFSGQLLSIDPAASCRVGPRQPLHLTVTITWDGKVDSHAARFPDACRPAATGSRWVKSPLWTIESTIAPDPGLLVVLEDIDGSREATGYMRFTLESGGRKQTIRVHFVHDPGGDIFEGTDAFVNYCIDGVHEIRSSGGRLYCFKDSADYFRIP